MKLCSFLQQGAPRIGVVDGDGVRMAADPRTGLENRHVMVRVKPVGSSKAGDAGPDDGDLHGGAGRAQRRRERIRLLPHTIAGPSVDASNDQLPRGCLSTHSDAAVRRAGSCA